ncbi:MAG: hypothetical protein CSB47_00440 [Proteobacteria bacterium]|nr:MAG: hypothetical protein CSB47_00440 [Pseudomonadota bacterium]
MINTPHDTLIQESQKWLEDVVIKHNFCPFAKRELLKNRIHFEVIPSQSIEACLEAVILGCEYLDKHADIETSLLILPNGFRDFDHYLDLLEYADRLLAAQNYEGTYQIASFHPDYCFDDTASDDPVNYTNRSPYPILHLLREASIEKALKHVSNPEAIPETNIKTAQRLGIDVLKKQLEECYSTTLNH